MRTKVIGTRVLKSVQNLNRIPEILRSRRHTQDWLPLTLAYVGLKARLPFQIKLATGPFEFREVGDIATFWQIFFRHIYPLRSSDRLIVDAGANIGAFTLYALQTVPQVKVVAVEPAPDSCNRVRSMLRAHNLESRCTLHEAALASIPGETTIEMEVGSQFRRSGFPGKRVPAVTLDGVLPPHETVDLLKMDVEGAEFAILPCVSLGTLRRIRRIALEYHPDASYRTAIDPLVAQGFNVVLHRKDGGGYGVVWLEQNH